MSDVFVPMNDEFEDVDRALRTHAATLTAVELAELLSRLVPKGLTQSTLIFRFYRAFPHTPLAILQEAATWARLGGDLDDEAFNRLLSPYLGAAADTPTKF